MTWALEMWAIPAQMRRSIHSATAHLCAVLPWQFAPGWTLRVHQPRASAQFYVPEGGTSIAENRVMQTLRPIAFAFAALGFVAIAGCTTSSGPDATLRVRNDSNFIIDELYLTQVNSST